jgi:hypothetical protein
MTEERPLDPGAYVGREPELAEETIPGGSQPGDERVAAYATRGDKLPETGDEAPPEGHREGEAADSARLREAGQDR